MADPTDQPAQQADPDSGEQVVRLDVGGWISGPCLDAGALELTAGWLPEPGPAWSVDGPQRPAQ